MDSTFKIVTDLYQLLRNTNQGQLVLDGQAKLTLPVFVLQKLNDLFLQLDNSSISEGITTELLQNSIYLQEFISKTPKLKLTHLRGPLPSEVDITRFVNLRYIELVHVNLQNVKGLQALRPQLELLACTSSTDSFEETLAGDPNSLQVWEELRTLDLSYNKIDLLGKTFISTPWIQHLDLSSNKLTYVGGSLEYLNNLKYLNLSYNNLDSLPFLSSESCRKLEVLLLCHNFIEDVSGLWQLNNLKKLDVSHNLLEDHVNIGWLSELDKVDWLSFIGNPLSYHRYHRTYICVCLSKDISIKTLVLDNRKLNSDEIKLVATRGRKAFTTSLYAGPIRREVGRKYLRTLSTCSSANSDSTVICVNVQRSAVNNSSNSQSGPSNNIQGIDNNSDGNIASTSVVRIEDRPSQNPSFSRSLSTVSSGRKMPKIREAVIVDADEVVQPPVPLPQPEGNGEHLEMKKEVEELRQRFGEEHWLHSHAGSFVQDLLGLQKTSCSTSILSDMTSSMASIDEENQQQSKLGGNTEDQRLSKVVLPDGVKINSDIEDENLPSKKVVMKEMSSNKQVSNINSSSVFSPIQHHDESNKRILSEDNFPNNDNTAVGTTSAAENYDDGNNDTKRFVGGNMADEGYDDEADDEEDEKDDLSHPWLVQKVLPGKLVEVFIVLKENELLEKDPVNNHTLVRWGLSTLLSCVKVNAQPPTVQLTFDTVRRNCDSRTYIMEQSDSQIILQRLGEVLESRPLSAMNQSMFKCMKCSSIFSRELKTTIIKLVDGYDISCEVCKSTLVVKIDENDDELEHLPSSGKAVTSGNSSNVGSFNSSTVAMGTSNNVSNSGSTSNNQISNTNSSPAIPVTQPKLSASPSQCSIGSAASLDQSSSRESPAAGLGDTNTVIITSQSVKCDSDIEIISNPSQSSIEVLEVQARLQGTNTPNRKRSSEERQTVAVKQLMTVPEVTNNSGLLNINAPNSGVLLTESSSSGSLTDSICTAYENHPPSSNNRRLPSQGPVGDKVIEETSPDNSPDNKTTNISRMQPPPSSGKNYNSILQDLLNSVNAKLESPDGPVSPTVTKLDDSDYDKVRYNYNNFGEVDHRIKLFLYEKFFKSADEHLILLLRASVIDKNNTFYPGCLVISTYSCFLLKVTGEESGDDAANFLEKVFTVPLSKLHLSRLSWDLGVLVNYDNNQYLLILHDLIRTSEFFKFASSVQRTNNSFKCLSDDDSETISSLPYVDSDRYMSLQNVLSANNNIKDSSDICSLSATFSTTIKRDNETDVTLPLACVANTSCELFILTSALGWLFKEDEIPDIYTVHNIINLIDVGVQGFQLSLHFLDESEGIEESWLLTFETMSAIDNIIESIRKPWEAIFSVPLQVTQFSNNDII